MTTIQRIARVSGWAFVVVAIWGAILAQTSMNADLETAPRLWGLFPVNFAHNFVHLLFGLWGIMASRSRSTSRSYAMLAGVIYIVLAVAGVFFAEGFGLVPLGSHNIWLHVVLGVALLVAGLVFSSDAVAADPLAEPAGTRTVTPPSRDDEPPRQPEGDSDRP